MTKINKSVLNALQKKCNDESSGIARYIYHDSPKNMMQIMLIAFKPNLEYPFIRDICDGKIIFNCLKGSITIFHSKEQHPLKGTQVTTLNAGEVLIIERKKWRLTKSGDKGAVFLESIEGSYDKGKREVYNK